MTTILGQSDPPDSPDPSDRAWLAALQHLTVWPSGVDGDRLALGLLENFQSPDPELRDVLSYTLLARLVDAGGLSAGGVRSLWHQALDDRHLFDHIGSAGDDSVFRRAFSVLVIPLLLDTPGARSHLSSEDVSTAVTAVLRYAREEQDWRGYVTDKGWAHAVAHTADALGSLGCDASVSARERSDILAAIHHLAMRPYPFGFLEDDRLAYAVFQMLASGWITEPDFFQWLDRFQRLDGPDDGQETLAGANAAHVLRSLYIRLLHQDRAHRWLEPVLLAADRFDIFLLYPSDA